MFYQLRAAELKAAVDEQRRAACKEQVALAARGGPNGDDAQLGAPSDALFAQPAEAVAQEMIARTGVRWSTAYKQPALTAVVVQTLHDAWEMAK